MKIGFIGSGDIAGYMAFAGRLNRRVKIVAVANPYDDEVRLFARRHGIGSTYSDYREMIAAESLDAVYICTPHILHYEMIRFAIEKKIHVLCEKPVTIDVAQAVESASLAESAGAKVGVNYQYRYDRGCNELIRTTRKGDLGTPLYAVVNVPWRRDEKYMSGWHATAAESGGGTLLTQASHCVDIAMAALGTRACSAFGATWRKRFHSAEVEDLGAGIIELENGAVIEVCSSMISVPEGRARIEVYGSDGTATYLAGNITSFKCRGTARKSHRLTVFDNAFSPLMRSLEGFRRWVVADRPYRVPIAEAIPVLEAIQGIYRSAESDRRVDI